MSKLTENIGEPPWMPKAGDSVVIIFGDCYPIGTAYRPVKVMHALPGWRFLLGDGSDVFLDKHITELQPAAGYPAAESALRSTVDPEDLKLVRDALLGGTTGRLHGEEESECLDALVALDRIKAAHEAKLAEQQAEHERLVTDLARAHVTRLGQVHADLKAAHARQISALRKVAACVVEVRPSCEFHSEQEHEYAHECDGCDLIVRLNEALAEARKVSGQ